jgi:hypothetical protein
MMGGEIAAQRCSPGPAPEWCKTTEPAAALGQAPEGSVGCDGADVKPATPP